MDALTLRALDTFVFCPTKVCLDRRRKKNKREGKLIPLAGGVRSGITHRVNSEPRTPVAFQLNDFILTADHAPKLAW